MLQIIVPAVNYDDLWDEEKQVFIPVASKKEQTLQLEHSLVSLSKWESKWCKPFFTKEEKSYEEIIDYIQCMTLNKNIDPEVYYRLTDDNISKINQYIEAPMTATTFYNDRNNGVGKRETITSELIYYWMIALNIPFECQKWHINRLITLIRVCEIKNTPPKKRSKREIASNYAALNAARRKQLNSKG